MIKKLATVTLLITIAATGVACGANNGGSDNSPTPAVTVSPTVNPDAWQASAYITVRLAEEKINSLFHDSVAGGKPVLKSVIANNKEEAKQFLMNYFDEGLAEQIVDHYWTDETVDGAVVVKEEPFLTASVIKGTKTKDDVTFAGDENEPSFTTPDQVTFKLKKTDNGKYVITEIQK